MRFLIERLADRLFRRQQFELWEASSDGRAYFMVASRLTRQQALDMAGWYSTDRLHTLVLDAEGTAVFKSRGNAASAHGQQQIQSLAV